MILEGARPQSLLLDTCAVIYLFNGEPVLKQAVAAIDDAAVVLVSPISAWEIGILSQKRAGSGPEFRPNPSTWFEAVLATPPIVQAPFEAAIALSSCTCRSRCTAIQRIGS